MPRSRNITAQSLKVRRDKANERTKRVEFVTLCAQRHLPPPVTEYQFAAPDRKWAFDLAWPANRIAIEVQGGIWVRGGHSRGAQQLRDFEKLNAAQLRGWRVFQLTPDQLCTAETIELVKIALQFVQYPS